MLEYARWKYLLVGIVLLLSLIFALPNVFGDAPALQVARKDHTPMDAAAEATVQKFLDDEKIPYSRIALDTGRVMVHFADVADQFRARDGVNAKFKDQYITVVLRLARPRDFQQDRHPPDAARSRSARRLVSAVSGGRRRRGCAGARRL
jgi:preprotein translocase subunit SecD